MKNFEEYKQAVVKAYQDKKKAGKLPANLDRYTPANLRNECLRVFSERFVKTDDEIFHALLEEKDDSIDIYQKLKRINPDKFKPLVNFLNGETDSPKERIIHLLAWLIDFKPRPYRPDVYLFLQDDTPPQPDEVPIPDQVPLPSSENTPDSDESANDSDSNPSSEDLPDLSDSPEQDNSKEENTRTSNNTDDPQVPEPDGDNNTIPLWNGFNKKVVGSLLLLVLIIGAYLIIKNSHREYMYWDGTQYQVLEHGEKVDGVAIVLIDTARLAHLRKITNVKLITRDAIGIVHYSKINGKVEFYTTGGENPEDTTLRLLPLTEYMFEKYIEPLKKGN